LVAVEVYIFIQRRLRGIKYGNFLAPSPQTLLAPPATEKDKNLLCFTDMLCFKGWGAALAFLKLHRYVVPHTTQKISPFAFTTSSLNGFFFLVGGQLICLREKIIGLN